MIRNRAALGWFLKLMRLVWFTNHSQLAQVVWKEDQVKPKKGPFVCLGESLVDERSITRLMKMTRAQGVYEAFGSCCRRSCVIHLVIVSSPARSDPCPSSVCPGMAGEEGQFSSKRGENSSAFAWHFFVITVQRVWVWVCRAGQSRPLIQEWKPQISCQQKKKDKKKETSEEQRRAGPLMEWDVKCCRTVAVSWKDQMFVLNMAACVQMKRGRVHVRACVSLHAHCARLVVARTR